MIKANELRIGGTFENNSNGLFEEGEYITLKLHHFYWAFEAGEGELEKLLKPIPLTPEILERCGFEEIYKSDFTIRFNYKLNGKIGAGWNLINGHFHVRYIGEKFTHVKQLHQLQNLYFALTGEELEIKELQQA